VSCSSTDRWTWSCSKWDSGIIPDDTNTAGTDTCSRSLFHLAGVGSRPYNELTRPGAALQMCWWHWGAPVATYPTAAALLGSALSSAATALETRRAASASQWSLIEWCARVFCLLLGCSPGKELLHQLQAVAPCWPSGLHSPGLCSHHPSGHPYPQEPRGTSNSEEPDA